LRQLTDKLTCFLFHSLPRGKEDAATSCRWRGNAPFLLAVCRGGHNVTPDLFIQNVRKIWNKYQYPVSCFSFRKLLINFFKIRRMHWD
jgi:hypothetical protein